MRIKMCILVIIILCAGLMSSAGTLKIDGKNRAASTAIIAPSSVPASGIYVAAAKPSVKPEPSPAHKGQPSQSPASIPTPAPTPTPNPWAKRFSPKGPYLSIKNPDRGPWVYRDETLSITITVPQTGRLKGLYCKADIYTRGPLPFGGFASSDTKGYKTALPYKIARENQAVLAITGDYISCGYNKKGVMIRNGKVYYDRGDAPTLAFMPSGEMKVYEPGKITAKQLLALGVKNSFAFGPILVKDGKMHPSVAKHKLNYHSYRAAIGQVEPGHYIIIVTRSAIMLTDLAALFIDAKCSIAYNMDGGYSAAMVFMGEQINKNIGEKQLQRSLPDLMMIGQSDAVPGEKAPVYGNGVSLNKKNRPLPVEGLISSIMAR